MIPICLIDWLVRLLFREIFFVDQRFLVERGEARFINVTREAAKERKKGAVIHWREMCAREREREREMCAREREKEPNPKMHNRL